ncbi:hypothetical protein [Ideonella sp. A 288]|uniref:hypothetical protein n=1 Tax=Ideonella sp. A 288 TaxID=1962181 RepID=UPI000B4B9610|nr:hypothetical protein [Ideonella sp. A 288]
MHKHLATGLTVGLLLAAAGAAQATDVGVSIGISQPGVYGRIDIGRFPQPTVVVAQPVIIQQPRMVVAQPMEPVYLWVPPGHRRNWRHHCARYDACGMPVMFVQDRWYRQHVAPAPRRVTYVAAPPPPRPMPVYAPAPSYQPHPGRGRDHDRGDDHRRGRGDRGHDDRGNGRGHGRGHD